MTFQKKGATGGGGDFDSSIASNFTVYQDRLLNNLLQLFTHRKLRMVFYIFSCFCEVNIVAEQKQKHLVTIF